VVGGDHKNTLKTTKGDEMQINGTYLLLILCAFYYSIFFIKVEHEDFMDKKELLLSVIPFYMWINHFIKLIKKLD
jgi:hypothetical protein